MAAYVTNAFSISMLIDSGVVQFERLTENEVPTHWGYHIWGSAVGHANTAKLFSSILTDLCGQEIVIEANRASIVFDEQTVLLVGQYVGPRLQEGITVLPKDAKIVWWLVRPY